MILFVISFCAVIFFWGALVRSIRSPESRRDLAHLREQKRIKKAARR